MTTKAANEGELGELQAKVMSDALTCVDIAQVKYIAAEDKELEGLSDVIPPMVSAPLLSVITKFLNDNKISCAPEDSKTMTELETRLANKRARKSVGNVVHLTGTED